MTPRPVMYVLDPDTREAYDVLWFCSTDCRALYQMPPEHYACGQDGDWIEGTTCEHCGVTLEESTVGA